jgi:polo-like kinase 1
MATKAQPASQRRDGDNNDAGTVLVEEKIVRFNGDICIKHYERGKFLGKGGFAKCYEFVRCDNKEITAAKIILKSSLQRSRAK